MAGLDSHMVVSDSVTDERKSAIKTCFLLFVGWRHNHLSMQDSGESNTPFEFLSSAWRMAAAIKTSYGLSKFRPLMIDIHD